MKRLLVIAALLTAWPAGGLAQPLRPQVPCPWTIPTGVQGPAPRWLGWLEIPRLGERVRFSRGTAALFKGREDNSVNHGPALYPNDYGFGYLPGRVGTVGILGHRTTHTHPFCRLDLMRKGYVVKLIVGRITYIYRVVHVDLRADPDSWVYFEHPARFDRSKAARGSARQYLVLAACTPPRYETYRINVVARLVQVIRP